jgi:signal transduction histidine kinase
LAARSEKPGVPSDRTDLLHRQVRGGIRVYHLLLAAELFILVGLSIYVIISLNNAVTQTAIASYQETELEIVREAARSTNEYVYEQTVVLGRTDIDNIEQEVYTKFVDPIRLLDSGDAWIYAPDHVVFDRSSDFPDIYRGKSMTQVFAIQKQYGASHYEEMTRDVTALREGTGYYIWLPEKGEEIAAWTPITIGNYTWTIGLSTPLPEILDATGAAASTRVSLWIFAFGFVVSVILFILWLHADIRQSRYEDDLKKTNEKLFLLSSITRHDILNQLTVLSGYLELSRAQVAGTEAGEYLAKAHNAAVSIEGHIMFAKIYQDIGVQSPAWQDVKESARNAMTGFLPAAVTCTMELDELAIYADPLFEKVIYTLADNSLRHGEHVTAIRLSYHTLPGGELVLVYEDNGVGIPAKDKDRIFEQGFGRNTGFGLFLAREILAITGLTICETGEAGTGVQFVITVPAGAYRITRDRV